MAPGPALATAVHTVQHAEASADTAISHGEPAQAVLGAGVVAKSPEAPAAPAHSAFVTAPPLVPSCFCSQVPCPAPAVQP